MQLSVQGALSSNSQNPECQKTEQMVERQITNIREESGMRDREKRKKHEGTDVLYFLSKS
ncbi:hypothetical protein PAMP_016314 [Pampus punctatissimus]